CAPRRRRSGRRRRAGRSGCRSRRARRTRPGSPRPRKGNAARASGPKGAPPPSRCGNRPARRRSLLAAPLHGLLQFVVDAPLPTRPILLERAHHLVVEAQRDLELGVLQRRTAAQTLALAELLRCFEAPL